jgi:hypothetical protein
VSNGWLSEVDWIRTGYPRKDKTMSRTDAYVRVTCDECGEEDEIELWPLARRGNWDERGVDAQLEAWGWVKDGEKDICEICVQEREEQCSP